jgi:hypothetical protein
MTHWPLHFEATGPVAAPPQALFDHLDDPHRLSAHMEQRSAAMMGTRMTVSTDSRGGRAEGSVIRMHGSVMGLAVALEEAVTERQPPLAKAWQTTAEPRLLVIGRYRMGFRIVPAGAASLLTVSIDYALPVAPAWRWPGRLLAPFYARWCCRRMLRDAQEAFAGAAPAPGAQER